MLFNDKYLHSIPIDLTSQALHERPSLYIPLAAGSRKSRKLQPEHTAWHRQIESGWPDRNAASSPVSKSQSTTTTGRLKRYRQWLSARLTRAKRSMVRLGFESSIDDDILP